MADLQHGKVRKGICRNDGTSRPANLADVVLWKYNYNTAQKAIAQRHRLISALEFAFLR